MLRFEFFSLNLGVVVMRYYLLMAVTIIGAFSGQWWIALLALPIFISAISGLKISFAKKEVATNAKLRRITKRSSVEEREAS